MIGQIFSHYKILAELGRGGMGVVYEAEDFKLQRRVALKFLPPDLTRDREAKARFIHEAQAASALQHNNICTIHEIDETDQGHMFICMDYYEGETFKDKVAKGPLPADKALDLTIHAAEGLVKAHAAGMVHRDIKAANLMVTTDGVVKILDFGLAKLAGQTKVTRTGTTMGTVAYMSPEQAAGKDVDQRSDIWSLGVVLYELLSGELPFKGEHELAVLFGITHSDPKPVTTYRHDIPEELDWIIGKALSKEPSERYDTSMDFLSDLRAALKSVQSNTGVAPVVKARRPKRKGKSFLLGAAVVTVVAAAVVIAILFKFLPGREQAPPTFLAFEGTPLVAVSGFENKTGDPSFDNVAVLTTETVAQDLAGLDLVETVIPGATPAGGEAGQDADIIVSGTVHLEGEDLGVVARVSEAESGRLICALPMIHADRASPGDAISEVSQRVMGGIAMRLHNPFRQVLPAHPPTYEAFGEYRLALDTFDAQWGVGPVLKAIEHLQRATELDTTFLRPLVFVPAFYLYTNAAWGAAKADTALRELEEIYPRLDRYERLIVDMLKEKVAGNHQAATGVAERLEPIAPQDQFVKMWKMNFAVPLGQPHRVLEAYAGLNPTEDQQRRLVFAIQTRIAATAQHDLGRYEEELKLRQRVIEYYPSLVLFRMDEAWAYVGLGRIDDIRRVLKECQGTPGGRGFLDWSLWTVGDMMRAHGYREEAIEIINGYIEERLERPGDDAQPYLKGGNLARLLYAAERWEEARAIFEKEPDNLGNQFYIGYIAARLGDKETANRIIAQYVDTWDDPYLYGNQFVVRARFAALMGDREHAVLLLREAAAQGHALGHGLCHDMDLEPLFGYPPFEELTRVRG